MKTISLTLNLHLAYMLKNYPFWKIGEDSEYFDDELNKEYITRKAKFFIQFNEALLKFIDQAGGTFDLNICISGTTLELFSEYSPEVVDGFRALSDSGHVEFLGTTYSSSLAALGSRSEFKNQVKDHRQILREMLNVDPKVFLMHLSGYTDIIGDILSELGFEKILGMGVRNMDDEKSILFESALFSYISLIMSNEKLNNKFKEALPHIINENTSLEEFNHVFSNIQSNYVPLEIQYGFLLNIMTNNHYWDKFNYIINRSVDSGYKYKKISDLIVESNSADTHLHNSIWEFEIDKDYSKCLLGNGIQQEAFNELYAMETNPSVWQNPENRKYWRRLQSSDHFYWMHTHDLPCDINYHFMPNPYPNPFQAFINYMNVLSGMKSKLVTIESKNYAVSSSW